MELVIIDMENLEIGQSCIARKIKVLIDKSTGVILMNKIPNIVILNDLYIEQS
jgi:hypothetical protein